MIQIVTSLNKYDAEPLLEVVEQMLAYSDAMDEVEVMRGLRKPSQPSRMTTALIDAMSIVTDARADDLSEDEDERLEQAYSENVVNR